MDTIEREIIKTRIHIAQLRKNLLKTENATLRMKIKSNTYQKRQLSKLIDELYAKIQPTLFTENNYA